MSGFLRQLFGILTPHDRAQATGLVAAVLALAVVEVAGVASIMPFMALVMNPGIIHQNPWLAGAYRALALETERSFVIMAGVGVLALIVLSNALAALNAWLVVRFSSSHGHGLATRLLARYLARPYEFFLGSNSADLGKNILNECGTVASGILQPVANIVAKGSVVVLVLGTLVAVDPALALTVFLGLATAYGLIWLRLQRSVSAAGRQRMRANTERFKIAGETLGGVKEIKLHGSEAPFLAAFSRASWSWARAAATNQILAQMPRYALDTLAFGSIVAVILYQLARGSDLAQMIPVLSLYAFAGYRLMPALQQIFAASTTIRFHRPMLERLHGDLAGEADMPAQPAPAAAPLPFERDLRTAAIRFRYAAAEREALSDLSLAIRKNTSVGLVGATGSGKSTLVDIILGLLQPQQGQLLVDGTPITAANLRAWQRNLGYVPQSIYLIDDTVARNIAFGVPEDQLDMAAVERAARIAHIHDFIVGELPRGYDTVVGERGVRLSGGQRQRIGIARALYRDPAVLVLDEATSALDNATEKAVMEAIRGLAHRKTLIMIAHRLSTVRDCDVIYLLEQGRVVAQGTYDALLAGSERFRELARAGA